ncbi:MAG: hypothetical protein QM757_08910 [Paludibaculum sp.]
MRERVVDDGHFGPRWARVEEELLIAIDNAGDGSSFAGAVRDGAVQLIQAEAAGFVA